MHEETTDKGKCLRAFCFSLPSSDGGGSLLRSRKDDYLFGEEWDAAHKEGYLSELRVAFSRDQPQKIYVQDKIREDPALVWRLLVENEGYFFFCGPARRAPQQVREGVEAAFVAAGNLTKQEAAEKVDELVGLGRYVVEAWA